MLGFGLGPYLIWGLWATAIVAAIAAACGKPRIGLYVLVPFLPNETIRGKLDAIPLGGQAIDILLLGITIGVFLTVDRVRRPSIFRAPIIAICVVTFLSLWLGSLFNNLPLPIWFDNIRLSDWKNYCRILLIVFLTRHTIRTQGQMFIVVALMCLSMAWVERGFIYSNLGRDFSTFAYEKRDAATMPSANENGLAAFFAQMALFLLAYASSQTRLRRWIMTTFGIFTVGCMVMVFSRGAYLGFTLGFVALGLLRRRVLVFTTITVVAVGVIIGSTLIPGAVIQRVTMTRSQDGQLEASAAERLVMWQLVTNLFYQYPICGAGFDTVKFLVHHDGLGNAHNYYIQLLGETGIIGLGTFLWLIMAALAGSCRLLRYSEDPVMDSLAVGNIVCILVIIVVNCFGDRWSYIEVTGYTCMMFGMMQRGLDLLEEPNEAEEQFSPDLTSSEATPVLLFS